VNIFAIKTPLGVSEDRLKEVFGTLGNVSVIGQCQDEGKLNNIFPLTHVAVTGNTIDPVSLKVQHLTAWEYIVSKGLPGGLVILDTVRLVDSFAKNIEINTPKDFDICIFSATNLQINGIHISNTDWVLLDSDDPEFNNICNAYYVSNNAAKKLYDRRNEMLSDPRPFGLYINSISNNMALDRIRVYMSMIPTSSKPIYLDQKNS